MWGVWGGGGGWTVHDWLRGTVRSKRRGETQGEGGRHKKKTRQRRRRDWGREGGNERERRKNRKNTRTGKNTQKKTKQQSWAHQQRFLISCQNVATSELQLLLSTRPNPPPPPPLLHTEQPRSVLIFVGAAEFTQRWKAQGVRDHGLDAELRRIADINTISGQVHRHTHTQRHTHTHRCQWHLTREGLGGRPTHTHTHTLTHRHTHTHTAFHSGIPSRTLAFDRAFCYEK